MKKKSFLKGLISFTVLVCILFIFVINPFAEVSLFGESKPKGYVTIDVEKFTLGSGYIMEPIKVPFYEGDSVAKLITEALGEDNYQNTGSIESGFYLSKIRDENNLEPQVPQYILDECGSIDSKTDSEWLGEFDYTFMSGWMYCVNNKFPNYGSSDYYPEDGDVIRWQFTLYGYGMDIGGGYSDEGSGSFGGSYVPIANKDKLTALIGDINSTEGKEDVLKKEGVQAAYNDAYIALETVDSSQETVDTALKNLEEALNSKKEEEDKNVEVVEPTISVQDAINETAEYLYQNVPNPTLGTSGGEWTVLSLARSGYNVPNEYYENYYSNVVSKLKECNGVLSNTKYTEYSRVILGLTAIGKDVTDVGGYNLLEYLADFNKVKKQGINGPIFALIALDSKNYEIPKVDEVEVQTTRDMLIDYILNKEIKKDTENAGGWALGGSTPDPDITAMALQALAKYKDVDKVKPYIERAVNKLSEMQNANGGYTSWGSANSESIAQVITALTALGIDPKTDERFIKSGNWVVSSIMDFYVPGGGFKHVLNYGIDGMATDQGMYALVGYNRFLNNQPSLYNMTDVEGKEDTAFKVQISLPEKVSGIVNTEFNLGVKIGSWPEGQYKLIDGVMNIPDGIEIVSVTPNNANISGGLADFGLENNTLRFVYGNTNLEDIKFTGQEFPAELFTVTARVKDKLEDGSNLNFAITNLELKAGSDENTTSSFDTTGATGNTVVLEDIKASARELYNGDGIDLIPGSKKAIAVEFVNLKNEPSIIFDNNTTLSYSEELSNKRGIATYVALVDSTKSLDDFNNMDKYLIDNSIKRNSLKFGDVNEDNIVNAQDALNTLSAWLRKSDAPEGSQVIRMNVTGDARINTYDALGIMEYYVNGREFSILNK